MHKGYLKALQEDDLINIESYLNEIDSAISQEDIKGEGKSLNLPILITGEACSGKSSVIANWVKAYKNAYKTDNDYFIIRFSKLSAMDTSYASLLYSIYNQIRVSNN
jgi:hypothetical protein